jgi:hypothetical protein
MEQELEELPGPLRELKLLEYMRLDFMSPTETKIFLRNLPGRIRPGELSGSKVAC